MKNLFLVFLRTQLRKELVYLPVSLIVDSRNTSSSIFINKYLKNSQKNAFKRHKEMTRVRVQPMTYRLRLQSIQHSYLEGHPAMLPLPICVNCAGVTQILLSKKFH